MSFLGEIRAHPRRFVKTLCFFSSTMSLGASLGILGPTLLDMCTQVERPLEDVATALPARAGGYAIGSFVSEYRTKNGIEHIKSKTDLTYP